MIIFGKNILKFHNRFTKNNQGMTMVEVLMGFVILMIMMGALSGIIAFSGNMLRESADLHRVEQRLQGFVYKKTPDAGASKLTDTIRLSNPKSGEVVDIKSEFYQMKSEDVLLSEETETLDVTIYYFKAPTTE